MKDYPNLLIINDESIYKKNATGITLRSLISNWPSENVYELHLWNPSQKEKEGLNIVANIIPSNVFPINAFFRRIIGASVNSESSGVSFGRLKENQDSKCLSKGIKEYLKYIGESKCINIKPIITDLKHKNFIPDVIYTMGSRFSIHYLSYLLAKYYDCGTCFHFMDNWRETAYDTTPVIFRLNKKLNKSIDMVMRYCNKALVISPLMKEQYEMLYGGKYEVLMNSVNVSSPARVLLNEKTTFIYAGGLHLDRYRSLLVVEEILKEINKESKMVIYTNDICRKSYEPLFDKTITEFRNFLPHDRMQEIFDEADILIHVESFDLRQINYTKYSLSTKIPEYMASGKPILCYAPSNISVFQYIKSAGAGLCSATKDELKESIQSLLDNPNFRFELGKKGFNHAMHNHNIKYAQDLFVRTIQENVRS